MNTGIEEVEVSKPRKGLAIASLLLGVFSILTLGLLQIGAVVGLISGILAFSKAKNKPTEYGGSSMAIVGITTSVVSFYTSVFASLLIVLFVVQPVKVEGTAMMPTFYSGDKVFLGKLYNEINRGDIAIFWFPDDPSQSFMKRVIGLPGETIRMNQSGQLFIDGQPVEEPYLSPERNRAPRVIPETYIKPHHYFVMGDNRDASNDSRSWGLVPEKYIYGKFWWRYDSGNSESSVMDGK
jgi:signal peptidase I